MLSEIERIEDKFNDYQYGALKRRSIRRMPWQTFYIIGIVLPTSASPFELYL